MNGKYVRAVFFILVTFSLVALSACQERPRPGYQLLDLSNLYSLDMALERARWEPVASQMRDNLFLPEAYQKPRSEDEKRKMIADFHFFSDVRAAVLVGRAPIQDRRAYYAAYIHQLEQRGAILRQLITSIEAQGANATSARAGLLARKERAEREQRYVQQARSKYQRLSREDRDSGERQGPRRPRVICVVTAEAFVLCIQEAKLAQYFMGGYWTRDSRWMTDRFNPAKAYQVFYQLDKIMDRFALDPKRNTFVRCANGAWFALDTQGPDRVLAAIAGPTDVNLPSVAEMAGMQGACEFLALGSAVGTVPGSGAGLGGLDSNWVPKVIGLANEAMKGCTEGPGSGVSSGAGIWWNVAKRLGADLAGKTVLTGSGLLDVLSLPSDIGEEAQYDLAVFRAAVAQAEAIEAHWDAQASEMYAQKAEADAAYAETVAANSKAAADNDPGSEEKRQQAEEDQKDAEEAKKEAERARQETEQKKKEAEEKEKKAEEEAKKAAKEARKTAGGYDPDGNYSTCEHGQSAWDFFKDNCDRQNGWDRPGSKCNDWLRRTAGCVDTSLINPTPDGDKTCMRLSSQGGGDVNVCRERQKVMSTVEPGDPCAPHGAVKLLAPKKVSDVCGNPAVRPAEGQCAGDFPIPVPVVQPIWGGPLPKPFRDVAMQNGVQIFDGLMLDGLGLGGLP